MSMRYALMSAENWSIGFETENFIKFKILCIIEEQVGWCDMEKVGKKKALEYMDRFLESEKFRKELIRLGTKPEYLELVAVSEKDNELTRLYFYDIGKEKYIELDIWQGLWYVGSYINSYEAHISWELVEEEMGKRDRVLIFI